MRARLTIGDFSQITHLSVKTLRRYHDAGLLEPAEVDPKSGYRYYATTQVPTAQVIQRFRDLGMPVREVCDVLATSDPQLRSALIARHLERLEDQLAQTRSAVASLYRLLQPGVTSVEVGYWKVPPLLVAAISATVGRYEVIAWYDEATAELDSTLASSGLDPAGPCGGLYDNELFTAERGKAVVYVPVLEPPTRGKVAPFVIPAGELATTVHAGAHDDIDISYGALGAYVAEHALVVAGPVREIYVVGPRQTDKTADWRTEIGWPVFHTTG